MLSTNEKVTQTSHMDLGVDKSFYALTFSGYGLGTKSSILILPFSFQYVGYYGYQNTVNSRSISCYYWSSQAIDTVSVYYLSYDGSTFNPQSSASRIRDRGSSIRCGELFRIQQ